MRKLLLILTIAISQMSIAQSLVPNKTSYATGETITFTYSGGSVATDWIGIYSPAVTPDGDPAAFLYKYVTPPSGTTDFTNSLAPGNYVAHYLADDGYTIIASSVQFTVLPSLVPNKTSYATGETISFTYSGGTGSATDWIGIYSPGETPDGTPAAYIYKYITSPSGSTDFTNTLVPGNYVAHLFSNDSYNIIVTSVQFAVLPSLVPNKTSYATGETISFTYSGGTGSATDWIGIYSPGETPDGTPAAYIYKYITSPSGSTDFTNTLVPGNYVAHLFSNDSYNIIVTSVQFTVLPSLVPNKTSYATGETISFTYSGGTGSATDWIGIYSPGETPDGTPAAYLYKYITSPSGSTDFTNTLVPGNYVAHLFSNDTYNIIVTSVQFAVLPSLVPNKTSYTTGETISFTYSGGTGSATDWIGIYSPGETPDGTPAAYLYKYITSPSGSTDFTNTLVPGNYVAHLFSNDTYNIIVTSVQFTVLPSLVANKTSYASAETITFTYSGATGAATDSIAIDLSPIIRIESGISDLVLAIAGNSNADGAELEQQTLDLSNKYQQWRMIAVGDSVYQFINVGSGKALDVTDAVLDKFDWNGKWHGTAQKPADVTSTKQHWRLEVSGSKYTIVNVGLDAAFNLWGWSSTVGDKNIALYGYYDNSGNELFEVIEVTPGENQLKKHVSSASGTLDFTNTLDAGTYVGHLYDGSDILATSKEFTVLAATSVEPNKTSYAAGESITFTYAGGTGSPTDWIGIYSPGETPDGDPAATLFKYISSASGTIDFTNTLAAGTYVAHLFCCDGYTIIDSSVEFTVAAPILIPNKTSYVTGETITFTYSGGTGSPTDWIGIYNPGETPDGDPAHYIKKYITSPSGTTDVTNTLAAGTYVAHLFCCDGYSIKVTSVQFTVAAPTLAPDKTTFSSGETITFSYTGGTGSTTDWIGIYSPGEIPDGDPAAYLFKYITSPSGSKDFTNTLAPGNYVAHLFSNDTYNIIVTSAQFTVAGIEPNKVSYASGETITFSYLGGTGVPTDSVSIETSPIVRIESGISDLVLGISDNSNADGTELQQQTLDLANKYQQWRMVAVGDSVYQFINVGSGKALDVTDAVLDKFDWNGKWHGTAQKAADVTSTKQHWRLEVSGSKCAIVNVGLDAAFNLWGWSSTVGDKNIALYGYYDKSANELFEVIVVTPSAKHLKKQITSPSGNIDFANTLQPGTYAGHLYKGMDIVAGSKLFTVLPQTSIVPDKTSYTSAEAITFTYSGGTGSPTDWIGIYSPGETPDGDPAHFIKKYIPSPSGTTGVTNTLAAGTYVAHLFCCDGYTIIDTSVEFTVAAPVLAPDKTSFASGENITFTYSGGTGSPTDWIGIYSPGETPDGDPAHYLKEYITSPTGTKGFTNTLAAGTYVAHLFSNDTYTIIVSSVQFTVAAPIVPAVSTNKATYVEGETVTISWVDANSAALDWIGIYREGETPGSGTPSQDWDYVSANAGSKGLPDGAGGQTPLTSLSAGTYVIKLLCCDGYTVKATSAVFTVTSSTASLVPNKTSYASGETISFTYSGGTGSPTDWIGIDPSPIFRIVVGLNENLVLSIKDNSNADGMELQQQTKDLANQYQLWKRIKITENVYQFINVGSGKALDITDGVLDKFDWNGKWHGTAQKPVNATSANQHWRLEASANKYAFVNVALNAAFNLWNESANNGDTNVALYGNYTKSANELFKLEEVTPTGNHLQKYITSPSGTIDFANTLAAGTYVARLYCCDGTNIIRTSAEFTVAASSSIISNKTSYASGEAISFTYTGGTGSSTDWIGIYSPGETPDGTPAAYLFKYILSPAGTIEFTNTLTAGTYLAHLFSNDTYNIISTSLQFTVTSPAGLIPNKTSYSSGESITFTYTGGTGSATDWIGIYSPGETPDGTPAAYLYKYITSPSGTMDFVNTLAAGTYVAHLFSNDTYNIISTSAQFTVAAPPGTLASNKTSYASGETITFTYTGGTGSPTDWIGIYSPGETPDGTPAAYLFKYIISPSGTIDFTNTLSAGNYVAHLFCCDGYNILATSAQFSIKAVACAITNTPAVPDVITRIGFGSCASQTEAQPTIDVAISKDPDLFIYLGDNMYADTYDTTRLKQYYQDIYDKRPEFCRIKNAVPLIATWDDHDYGNNDEDKDYPWKAQSQKYFLDFWGEPANSPRRQQQGIYTSYVYGTQPGKKVQVILLDTRYFLDNKAINNGCGKNAYCPMEDPKLTILGDAQWTWLEEQLKVPADLRIIGSSITFGVAYNGWEGWANFPLERDKMTNLIKSTEAEGVVFISGDLHYSEISAYSTPGLYRIYDFTSSGINKEWRPIEPNKYRVPGTSTSEESTGLLEIDWENKTLKMSSYGASNNLLLTHTISLDELKNVVTSTEKQRQGAFKMSVYPNPSKKDVNVKVKTQRKGLLQLINIYNGQVMKQVNVEPGERDYKMTDIPAGVYTIVVRENGSLVHREKIIVTH